MYIKVDSIFLERIVSRMIAEQEEPPCERRGIDRFSCFYDQPEYKEEDGSCCCNCVNGVILAYYHSASKL